MSEKIIPKRAPKPEKVTSVADIKALLDRHEGVVMTDYRGFTVAEKSDLTRRLRECGAEYHVVKNTLFRLAYGGRGEDPGALLSGPTGVVYAGDDPGKACKILLQFLREKRKGEVKGALVRGRVFNADGVKALSELPTRDVLLGQVVGAMQGPMASLVYTLQGVTGGLVRTIQAIHDQKAGA